MSCMGHIWSLLKPLKFSYYGTNGYHIQDPQGELKSKWENTFLKSLLFKISKEHFILSTIYETFYIFLMIGGRAVDWDLTLWVSIDVQQTAF